MMFRKICCLLAILCLFACPFALAEEAPAPVTGAELTALLASVRAEIGSAAPLNNPADEASQREDGILHQFEAAKLYADGTELTAETPVNALVFEDSEGEILRSTGIDTQWIDLLAAYPLDNKTLAGTREAAVLYLSPKDDGGFFYGTALRDGQRLTAATYGEIYPENGAWRETAVTYSLFNGLVSAIRVDGLNPASVRDAADVSELFSELTALAAADEYRAVKTSRNGLELTPFSPEDLIFSGIRYSALSPDTLPDEPERELMDNEDGTWLMRCDGDGYEAVFQCDAEGANARILSFTILDENTEGPRCVRLGDLFSDDYCRFRSGENEMNDDLTELLYGTEGAAPWGLASYDYSSGETSLRYVTALDDGAQVELLLKYEQNTLKEIIVHTV